MQKNPKTSIIVVALLIALWLVSAKLFYQPPQQASKPAPTSQVPDFKAITPVKARKAAFFDFLLPMINSRNEQIMLEREQLLTIQAKPADALTRKELRTLKRLAERYNVATDNDDWLNAETLDELLTRVDIVPPSLALAQAASESGWGRSRFARLGHNYFGEWCFSAGCGFVPKNRPEGAIHEVRRFEHPKESVAGYFYNLNTGDGYQDLRTIRAQLRAQDEPLTGLKLAQGLLNYSERREDYIADIELIIRSNKLTRFDETDGTP